MVSEAVRRSASWSGCGVNGEGGVPWPEGSSAASNPWEPRAMVSEAVRRRQLVRMRSRREGPCRRVRRPPWAPRLFGGRRAGPDAE